jgi:HEAT repeat protein
MRYKLGEDKVKILLEIPDENTRLAAGYALYRLGNKTGAEILRKGIISKNQTVRGNAATLLGKSGDESALKLLYLALHDEESDDRVQFQAVESIARLGDKKIFNKLWAVVFSGFADDRIMGARAMAMLGTSKARDVLLTKLDDEILEVRLVVAEQLGILSDTSGETKVLEVFDPKTLAGMDPEGVERVKTLAALAIGRIGTNSLTRCLPDLLTDNSKFVQIAAAQSVLLCEKREKALPK